VKSVGRGGELWMKIRVTHILHKSLPNDMLDEEHDERGISTCPRWGDRDIPNLLKYVIKYEERFLLLDCIN
jgi:hypothetical protein